jgi:hypothetical protein
VLSLIGLLGVSSARQASTTGVALSINGTSRWPRQTACAAELSTHFGRRYGDEEGVGSLSVGSVMGTWDGKSNGFRDPGHGVDPGDAPIIGLFGAA